MKIRVLLDMGCMFLLLAAIVIPVLSWVFSVFGLPCNSLFSDEGYRWVFLNIPESVATHGMISFVCFVVAYGALRRCGLFGRRGERHSAATLVFLFILVVFAFLLAAAALYSESPLLSVTGTLEHSAYLHGLPFAVSLSLTLASVSFGILSGSVRNMSHLVDVLTYGISHYSKCLLLGFLVTLVYKECCYVWG